MNSDLTHLRPADRAKHLAAEPLLTVEDLTLEVAGARLVDGVSFALGKGEVLALVGESGCGKSLTALALLRLLPPGVRLTRGHVRLEGTDLARLSERAMRGVRGERLSIIFQEPTASLDPLATVGSQIAEAYAIHRGGGRAEARQAARTMLEAVGIPDPERRLHQYPFELSGGMCQRIMIAIALVCGPALLVADEPTDRARRDHPGADPRTHEDARWPSAARASSSSRTTWASSPTSPTGWRSCTPAASWRSPA
jgi:peptide/nickel transport system ATP-binding protein